MATLSKGQHDGKVKFPSFFSSESQVDSPMSIDNVLDAAKIIQANQEVNKTNGVLLAVPIPIEHSLPSQTIDTVINEALDECAEKGIEGKEVTPFILEKVNQMTQGQSLAANTALIENNALVGSQIAVQLSRLKKGSKNDTK